MAIKLGLTGVRATYNEFQPEIILRLAQCYATYLGGGRVAVAADTRPSGKFIREALVSGLMACGATVYDYGILPTPVLQWLVQKPFFNGGVSITAAHNSYDWNSLVFLNPEGSYLLPVESEEFFSLYHAAHFSRMGFETLGGIERSRKFVCDYFSSLKDESADGAAPQRFCFDCAGGAAGSVLRDFADVVKIDMIPIFCGPSRTLDRDPEPTVRNAELLSTVVRETGCSGGFLFNSDATRVLVVDEKGRPFSEELTLPLFAHMILAERKSSVVTTYSSAKLIDRIAAGHGVQVFRTDVGPPSVIQKALDVKAGIAGEGSGSVCHAPFSYGYDSFFFIRTLVRFMRDNRISLSALLDEFGNPEIIKETLFLQPHKVYSALERVEKKYVKKIRLRDGFYVESGDEWICIRASSTMAMIRIQGEGTHIREEIEAIRDMIG